VAPELYPAVDILGGRAVRLVKGEFDRSTEYAADPLDAARGWIGGGARRLHVVDLDGARQGEPVNLEQLERIATLGVPVQYGGGLRSIESAKRALEAGATRVVLGTVAFKDAGVLEALLEEDPERVAVAVDVRGGKVATAGWTERTELGASGAIDRLREKGVRTIVFTNVDLDGTLAGIDEQAVRDASSATREARLVYSGGVGSLDHLRALAALDLPNLEGVIVGKALYEGRFTVAEGAHALTAACSDRPGGL
jgi:phosphoribosylformimino-5-aminoimidazole carboxamide ribotide isomerase